MVKLVNKSRAKAKNTKTLRIQVKESADKKSSGSEYKLSASRSSSRSPSKPNITSPSAKSLSISKRNRPSRDRGSKKHSENPTFVNQYPGVVFPNYLSNSHAQTPTNI